MTIFKIKGKEVEIGREENNKAIVLYEEEDIVNLREYLELTANDNALLEKFNRKEETHGINGKWNLYCENRYRKVGLLMYLMIYEQIEQKLKTGMTNIFVTRASTHKNGEFGCITGIKFFDIKSRNPEYFDDRPLKNHSFFGDFKKYKDNSLSYPCYIDTENFKRNPLARPHFKNVDQFLNDEERGYAMRLFELGSGSTFLKNMLIFSRDKGTFGIVRYVSYGNPGSKNRTRIVLWSEANEGKKGSTWDLTKRLEVYSMEKTVRMLSQGVFLQGMRDEAMFAPQAYQKAAKELGFIIPDPEKFPGM